MKPPPAERPLIPTLEEAAALLARSGEQRATNPSANDVEAGLWAHSVAVATVALRLAAALVQSGKTLNLEAVVAGALLHDVGKGERNHAHAGAQLVAGAGFPAIADIVAAHTELPPADVDPISEAGVVYLADKLIRKDRLVPLESRFDHAATRFAGDSEALAAVTRRKAQALQCRDSVAAALDEKPESIAAAPSDHPLETRMAETLRALGKYPLSSGSCWPTRPLNTATMEARE